MSLQKSYAVFGLGRYGLAVARELVNSGAEILAVDINESVVNSVIGELPYCKCADITNEDNLRRLGVSDMDVVIIAMASNLEASVMAVMLCKEVGVKHVIVKCANEMHRRILSRVGADQVLIPEMESGTRLAKNLLSAGFLDVMELSDDVSLIEMEVKPEWVGKSLIELNLRKKFSINVVAIRSGVHTQIEIDPNMQLTSDMKLILLVHKSKLKKLKH